MRIEYYRDAKGRHQGSDIDMDDDGVPYDVESYKDGKIHGLRFMYDGFKYRDLVFKGFFRMHDEVGFWFTTEQYL